MKSCVALTALIAAALAMTGAPAAQQTAAQIPPRAQSPVRSTGTGVISGVVLAAGSPAQPLRRVTVVLTESTSTLFGMSTSTDAEGRYTFTGLPAATYFLRFEKSSFIPVEYGASRPGAVDRRPIVLSEGQIFVAKPVMIPKGAVVAGRVTDQQGRPIRVMVQVAEFVTNDGRPTRRVSTFQFADTNQHGDYRIHGIQPGVYFVAASSEFSPPAAPTDAELRWLQQPTTAPPPASRRNAFSPTLYPGVSDLASATPIKLAAGDERLGIDIVIRTVPTATVKGTVTMPDGKPAAATRVWRTPKVAPWSSYALTSTPTAADGSFTMTGVPPGEWLFAVRAGGAGLERAAALAAAGLAPPNSTPLPPERLWAIADVTTAGQDIEGVTLMLRPPLQLTGRVIVEGAKPVEMRSIQLRLARNAAVAEPFVGSLSLTIAPDGSFTFGDLIPGTYGVRVTTPAGIHARSAVMAGKDLLDHSIEIAAGQAIPELVVTVTDRAGQIDGRVTNAAGAPVTELSVLVFSTDPSHWTTGTRRVHTARVTEAGTYLIGSLPAGDYYLCALAEVDRQLMIEADYLRQLVPSSIRLTLAEGEKKTQNLQAGGY